MYEPCQRNRDSVQSKKNIFIFFLNFDKNEHLCTIAPPNFCILNFYDFFFTIEYFKYTFLFSTFLNRPIFVFYLHLILLMTGSYQQIFCDKLIWYFLSR